MPQPESQVGNQNTMKRDDGWNKKVTAGWVSVYLLVRQCKVYV